MEKTCLHTSVSLGTMKVKRSEARASRDQAVLFIMEGVRSIGRMSNTPVMILRCFGNDVGALLQKKKRD